MLGDETRETVEGQGSEGGARRQTNEVKDYL